MESYDLDTDEFLGEWKNEDYVDKTNDLTYRLESQVQHRNDNTYINTETSSVSDSYESYGSSDIMELEPSVNTGSDVESITAAEQEALSSGNLEKYLDLGDSVSLGGEIYVPVERAEQYAKWMIKDALSETERLQEDVYKRQHKSSLNRTAMLMLAVTIHNFPEGAACGAIFAGVLSGDGTVTMAGALTLAIGIAIQNFPEGAIISLPLRSEGNKRRDVYKRQSENCSKS